MHFQVACLKAELFMLRHVVNCELCADLYPARL